MTYPSHALDDVSLSLPITQTALSTAQQFANEQPTPQKAEQVRLNTLAVYVIHDYLQMMGIPTNLKASDSWNPVMRLCTDVADLEVTGIGRLECRPHRGSGSTCYVPPEVWLDRMGYVVVEIDEHSLEARILGFTQTIASESFPLSQLQPIESLIDCINPEQPDLLPQRKRANLSQWLVNTFEQGWETLETLLTPVEPNLAFRFRTTPDLVINEPALSKQRVSRAKLIDLGMHLAGHPIALVVELIPESEHKTNILLQVHPAGSRIFLPPLLQLTVLDENGEVFLEAKARSADNYIQLQFNGLRGELFCVKVAMGDVSVVEDFVI